MENNFTPINQTVKCVDSNTWLIGGRLLCERIPHSSDDNSDNALASWKDDSAGTSYRLTLDPFPAPANLTDPDPKDPHMRLHYEAGGSGLVREGSAVWAIGNNAFCKVKTVLEGVTPEKDSINYVEQKITNRKFAVPKVIYSMQLKDRSILILERLPGRTLDEAWATLDSTWKQKYIDMMVQACKDMAVHTNSQFCGVDGRNLSEYYLTPKGNDRDMCRVKMQKACGEFGMPCSEFVFYHPDLGPVNIIVEETPREGTLGIIDWEGAGFYPKGWVATKFGLSGGMVLPDGSREWQKRVQQALVDHGFETYAQEWLQWAGLIPREAT